MAEIQLSEGQGVLLRKAVAPLLYIAEVASLNISPEGICLMALDTSHWVIVMLHTPSSCFTFFHCHDGNGAAVVNLGELYRNLYFAGYNDSATIHCDYERHRIIFQFHHPMTRNITYCEMLLPQDNDAYLNASSLQEVEYEMVVGIPSTEFIRIIEHLGFFGETVSVTVTDTQAKFSAVNEEIVLSKANGECIIGGAADDDPVHVSFSLHQKYSLLNASLLSSTVWILDSDRSHILLNCPVAAIGNIKFYFVLR